MAGSISGGFDREANYRNLGGQLERGTLAVTPGPAHCIAQWHHSVDLPCHSTVVVFIYRKIFYEAMSHMN